MNTEGLLLSTFQQLKTLIKGTWHPSGSDNSSDAFSHDKLRGRFILITMSNHKTELSCTKVLLFGDNLCPYGNLSINEIIGTLYKCVCTNTLYKSLGIYIKAKQK